MARNTMVDIYINNSCSRMGRVYNYIDYDDNNYIEYFTQAMEYDAELFTKEFLELFSKEFLLSEDDKRKCASPSKEFYKICAIYNEDERNIIHFSKIYKLNIEEYIKSNKKIFEKDEIIFNGLMEKTKKIN